MFLRNLEQGKRNGYLSTFLKPLCRGFLERVEQPENTAPLKWPWQASIFTLSTTRHNFQRMGLIPPLSLECHSMASREVTQQAYRC